MNCKLNSDFSLSSIWIWVVVIIISNISGGKASLAYEWTTGDGRLVLQASLGVALPSVVGQEGSPCPTGRDRSNNSSLTEEDSLCIQFGDYASLSVSESSSPTSAKCSRVEWISTQSRRLEDCFHLAPDAHWYGGGSLYNQSWPLAKVDRAESPYVTGDYTSTLTGALYGGIIENYFLLSTGVSIHVDEDTRLFVRWNSSQVCFISKHDSHPYPRSHVGSVGEELTLKYDVCVASNVLEVYKATYSKYYKSPVGSPEREMILHPFWSTWNEFNAGVNESVVLAHAARILDEGYGTSSHFEIDDGWETTYGQSEFDPTKFPNPAGMVKALNAMGFKVTLWTHPFINFDSPVFDEAVSGGFLLKDPQGRVALTSWWHGEAGAVDFTNPSAVNWWRSRLERLRSEIGIASFKFDAGEIDRMPYAFSLNKSGITNSSLTFPNAYTAAYVKEVAKFGGMVEVRCARGNQDLPIFFRMLDKGSRWGYDNGLRSLIPSLLHFSILGYFFTLPDMIGGNNYKPSGELYIRWMQANTFMPAVQFSIVPWGYEDEPEVSEITKAMLSIRAENSEYILRAVDSSIGEGLPIIRPLWFVDPEDPTTFTVDDQYMVGNDILVAPVLTEGAVVRDIYLPTGHWDSPGDEYASYDGPVWLRDYPADLKILPYFYRRDAKNGISRVMSLIYPIAICFVITFLY